MNYNIYFFIVLKISCQFLYALAHLYYSSRSILNLSFIIPYTSPPSRVAFLSRRIMFVNNLYV